MHEGKYISLKKFSTDGHILYVKLTLLFQYVMDNYRIYPNLTNVLPLDILEDISVGLNREAEDKRSYGSDSDTMSFHDDPEDVDPIHVVDDVFFGVLEDDMEGEGNEGIFMEEEEMEEEEEIDLPQVEEEMDLSELDNNLHELIPGLHLGNHEEEDEDVENEEDQL